MGRLRKQGVHPFQKKQSEEKVMETGTTKKTLGLTIPTHFQNAKTYSPSEDPSTSEAIINGSQVFSSFQDDLSPQLLQLFSSFHFDNEKKKSSGRYFLHLSSQAKVNNRDVRVERVQQSIFDPGLLDLFEKGWNSGHGFDGFDQPGHFVISSIAASKEVSDEARKSASLLLPLIPRVGSSQSIGKLGKKQVQDTLLDEPISVLPDIKNLTSLLETLRVSCLFLCNCETSI